MLQIVLLCSLQSPIHLCIIGSHALDWLLADDFRIKKTVNTQHPNTLHCVHLIVCKALTVWI